MIACPYQKLNCHYEVSSVDNVGNRGTNNDVIFLFVYITFTLAH